MVSGEEGTASFGDSTTTARGVPGAVRLGHDASSPSVSSSLERLFTESGEPGEHQQFRATGPGSTASIWTKPTVSTSDDKFEHYAEK